MLGPCLLALAAASASSASVDVPLLIGQRTISGAENVLARDSDASIAVAIDRVPDWSIALELGARPIAVEAKIEHRLESDVLRFHIAKDVHGTGALVLRAHGKEARRWSIKVSSLEDDAPVVFAAQQLWKNKKYDDAITALAPELQSSSLWIRTWAEVERGNVAFLIGERAVAADWWLRASDTAALAGIEGEAILRLEGVAYL